MNPSVFAKIAKNDRLLNEPCDLHFICDARM